MRQKGYLHCLAQIFSFSLLDMKVSGEIMDYRNKHGCGLERVDDHILILMRPTDDPRSPNTGSENSHDLDNKRTVTHLLVDDLAVYFSSGDVIIATQSDVEVALVVAEVEVDLATVVQDVDFACWFLYMST
jgi:hypothetical protein